MINFLDFTYYDYYYYYITQYQLLLHFTSNSFNFSANLSTSSVSLASISLVSELCAVAPVSEPSSPDPVWSFLLSSFGWSAAGPE